ncbi:hypothetical protein NL676_007292 [Syzygium grande]|nr:hypothetical protein NL676_007292 [Syzygium grande]
MFLYSCSRKEQFDEDCDHCSCHMCFCTTYYRRCPAPESEKEDEAAQTKSEAVDEIITAESLQFDFGTIREATDNFSDSKKLGQGGFGAVYMVWKNWREGSISNIIDPSITFGPSTEIMRCIQIGLLCVQENASSRPTMASVLLMLNSHSVTLQVPSKPAFLLHNGAESDMPDTQDYSSRVSEVERSRSKSNQFSKTRPL